MCVSLCNQTSKCVNKLTRHEYRYTVQLLGLFLGVGGAVRCCTVASLDEVVVVFHACVHQVALCCSVSSLFDVGGTGGAGMKQQWGCVRFALPRSPADRERSMHTVQQRCLYRLGAVNHFKGTPGCWLWLKRTKHWTDAEALLSVCSVSLPGKPHDPLRLTVVSLLLLCVVLSVSFSLSLSAKLRHCNPS